MVKRFRREVKIHGILTTNHHNNIVPAHDVVVEKSTKKRMLVLQIIEGETIDELVGRGMKKTLREALGIVLGIAEGLQLADELNIVHRDIHSGNIMIDGKGVPKIIDVGLSVFRSSAGKSAFRVTRTRISPGRSGFKSAEQTEGVPDIDSRADVYGLGCVFFHILTGKDPARHKQEKPGVQLSFLNCGIDVDDEGNAEKFLKMMCAEDRKTRCRPAILVEHIKRFLADPPLVKTDTLTPAETSSDDLEKMSQKVEALRLKLKKTILLHHIKENKNLFASNADGPKISITVSSLILSALHTTGDSFADNISKAIINEKICDVKNQDHGAWYGEDGYCHVMDTAWAISACLQAKHTLISDLNDSIDWLINAQTSYGWGFKKGMPEKVFYTTFAINALIEAHRAHEDCCINDEFRKKIRRAIDNGVTFLLDPRNRCQKQSGVYLWKQRPGRGRFCIASTAMAVHVLAKYYKLTKDTERATDLKNTLVALCEFVENGIQPDGKGIITCGTEKLRLPFWPEIRENAPSYWYIYFTPILATTLLTSANDIKWNRYPAKEIIKTIQWILDNAIDSDEGTFVEVEHGVPDNALWPPAQSIIVLHRWQEAVMKELSERLRDKKP